MPAPARRRSACFQLVERVLDLAFVIRGFENETGGAGIDDDRDAVLVAQHAGKLTHGGLDQGQLVAAGHGPGYIQQEDEVCGRPFLFGHLVASQPDPQEV